MPAIIKEVNNLPIISQFYGIIVMMFFEGERHHIPHIHIDYAEYSCIFDFDGNIIKGNIPKKQEKLVQAWIEIHKCELQELWKLAKDKKRIFKIKPLN